MFRQHHWHHWPTGPFVVPAGPSGERQSPLGAQPPTFDEQTEVRVDTGVTVVVADPLSLTADGRVDGAEVDGRLTWAAGEHEVAAGTMLVFPAQAEVPHVSGLPAYPARPGRRRWAPAGAAQITRCSRRTR